MTDEYSSARIIGRKVMRADAIVSMARAERFKSFVDRAGGVVTVEVEEGDRVRLVAEIPWKDEAACNHLAAQFEAEFGPAPLGDNRTASPELRRLNAPLPTSDPVRAPAHYGAGDVYETINVIEAWRLDFCLGNVVKYISRAGKKDPAKFVEDLEKARWYLDRRIEQIRRQP